MTLEQKINDELKEAMKSKNQERLDTLRSIRASIIEFAKSGINREMNNDDEIKILNTLAKRRKDAIEMYANANRTDLKDKEERELLIIQEFLPAQLSDDEIKKAVLQVIADTGANSPKDLGKVIGMSVKKLAGQADGSKIQKIVKESLGITE